MKILAPLIDTTWFFFFFFLSTSYRDKIDDLYYINIADWTALCLLIFPYFSTFLHFIYPSSSGFDGCGDRRRKNEQQQCNCSFLTWVSSPSIITLLFLTGALRWRCTTGTEMEGEGTFFLILVLWKKTPNTFKTRTRGRISTVINCDLWLFQYHEVTLNWQKNILYETDCIQHTIFTWWHWYFEHLKMQEHMGKVGRDIWDYHAPKCWSSLSSLLLFSVWVRGNKQSSTSDDALTALNIH